MTRQDKKRYLYGYYFLDDKIRRLKEEYETIFTQATKTTPSESDGSQHMGNADSKIEKYAVKLANISAKIDRVQNKKDCIERELKMLKPHQRYLIEQIDLKHIPVTKVAERINRSEKTIRNNRNRIIDKMFIDRS